VTVAVEPSGPVSVTDDPSVTSDVDGTTFEVPVSAASGDEVDTSAEVPAPLAVPLELPVEAPTDWSPSLEPSVVATRVPDAEQPTFAPARFPLLLGRAPEEHDEWAVFDAVLAPAFDPFLCDFTQTVFFVERRVDLGAFVLTGTALAACVRGAAEQLLRFATAGEPPSSSSAAPITATTVTTTTPRRPLMLSSSRRCLRRRFPPGRRAYLGRRAFAARSFVIRNEPTTWSIDPSAGYADQLSGWIDLIRADAAT
jgi:hypothetical protein